MPVQLFLVAAIIGAATFASAKPAAAQVSIQQANLHQHCAAKYRPRGIQASAEPIRYTPYGPQLLCRLVGVPYGYMLDNQSVEEVCLSQTGSSGWRIDGGRILCTGGGGGSAGSGGARTTRCAWAFGRLRC